MNAGPGHPSAGGGKHKRRRGRRPPKRGGPAARWAATARSIRGSLPLPWITATAPTWAGTTATATADRDGPGFSASYPVVDPEPLPAPRDDAASRVFAFVEDLFFLSKIQDTGRKMNVKVEFVKNEKELTERMKSNGEEKPSLIIFDLNNANAKPLTLIPQTEKQAEEGNVDHRISLARAGRPEAESARSGL